MAFKSEFIFKCRNSGNLIMQKKILYVLLVLVIIISFFYGVGVGLYKFPPYEILNTIHDKLQRSDQIENNNSLSIEQNVTSLIHINNENDVLIERTKLIQYIWKQNEFPYDKLPSDVDNDVKDSRYSDMKNLLRIEKITTKMDYGVNSIAYLFLAKDSNNKLLVYHQGHDGDFILGKKTIQFFLDNNYSVLALSMPLTGMNNQPNVNLPNFGILQLTNHDDLQFLESKRFSPIKYFVEPIAVSLNYIEKNYHFNSYYMTGVSGGGWTTAFYASIDPRITKSYPVAGTAPMYLRFHNPKNIGDYEQMLPALYNTTNYLDQYIMASYGPSREQMQIFNKNDPCCFSGTGFTTYENIIKQRVASLGQGKFSIFLDEENKQHSISEKSLKVILQDMQN